jgi:type I restriction enzyme S subunit
MNAKDLKNSILQLAIQGKLVEQREEEGTAKELIEKIQAEKKRLIKEGKIKKQKSLPAIKEDEMPFDIPESWEWVRFGEVINVVSARRVHQSDWRKSGVPFYRAREIGKLADKGYVDNELYIDEELFNKFSESGVPQPGDLMVTAVGTLGKTYIVKGNDRFYYKDASVICFENFSGINSMYLKKIMESKMIEKQIKSNSGGTTVATLTMVRTNMYVLPLPPLEEQKRIVAKIEELMPYVDKYDVAYSAVEELNKKFPEDMQKSILQFAIQGKIVEQREEDGTAEKLYQQIKEEKKRLIKEGKIKKTKNLPEITEDEIPFDIPENWKWVRIAEMSYFQEGPGIMAKDFRNSGIPLIRIAGMQKDKLSLDGCNYLDPDMVEKKWSHFKLDLGDIVISTSASMDKICEVTEETVGAIPYTGQIRFKMFGNISKEYFKYFIMSNAYIKQINEQKSGGTIKHYGPTHLNKMIIPLPPLTEQKRIVSKIEQLVPCTKQIDKKV